MPDPDHRLMSPPSLRIAKRTQMESGTSICVWDLRIGQPNVSHLPMAAIHSLEHFLGVLLPRHSPRIVNVAPMGCQTGFYIISVDLEEFDVMAECLAGVLKQILAAKEVPLANTGECGWAENHSLIGAQEIAGWLLRRRTDWTMAVLK
jgi:S-ribosylhomocysteine lyase